MKNIIICCDGTGNEISENISNILKLYRCMRKTPRTHPFQAVFYDPGVGTLVRPDPWRKLKQDFIAILGPQPHAMLPAVRPTDRRVTALLQRKSLEVVHVSALLAGVVAGRLTLRLNHRLIMRLRTGGQRPSVGLLSCSLTNFGACHDS